MPPQLETRIDIIDELDRDVMFDLLALLSRTYVVVAHGNESADVPIVARWESAADASVRVVLGEGVHEFLGGHADTRMLLFSAVSVAREGNGFEDRPVNMMRHNSMMGRLWGLRRERVRWLH